MEDSFFWGVLLVFSALAALASVSLFFVDAPYGRFTRPGFGRVLPSARAWLCMESPAAITFLLCTPSATFLEPANHPTTFLLTCLFVLHYVHRSVVYPLAIPPDSRSVTLTAALMAAAFNVVSPFLVATSIHSITRPLPLVHPQLWLGLALFAAGAAVNVHSDYIILALKRRHSGRYIIPRGGVFRWVSCAPYLGEIVEWAGWLVASNWAPGALVFWLSTLGNLIPRAIRTHHWYLNEFGHHYVRLGRRAIIPWVL